MKLYNDSQEVERRPAYRHSLGTLILAITFLLPLASPKVARAQDTDESVITSPVTGLWQSVAKGVGKDVGSTTAGWVMSAIGISNSANQEQADLTEIIDLLEQISGELSAIETDFDDLKCETAQDNVALNNSITKIGGLYDRYTDYVTNFNTAGTIPSWGGTLGVQTWLDDIFEPESGVQAQLIAIQNALIERMHSVHCGRISAERRPDNGRFRLDGQRECARNLRQSAGSHRLLLPLSVMGGGVAD